MYFLSSLGTAGNGFGVQRNAAFTTKDRDNDAYGNNCAQTFKGGWWYTACHSSNLNGRYLNGPHKSYVDGVNWSPWLGQYNSLRRTEIKIKPALYLA